MKPWKTLGYFGLRFCDDRTESFEGFILQALQYKLNVSRLTYADRVLKRTL